MLTKLQGYYFLKSLTYKKEEILPIKKSSTS